MTKPRQFFARFVKRNGRFTTPLVTHGNNVRYKAWNYIGATYDGNTGMATLWVNNRPVVRTNIGRIRLATNRPVRMGAKIGDRRYFRGKVSCVQVYSVALNRKQIINAAKRCFKRKIRELKHARFWDADGNRKWAVFPFNLSSHDPICIAKYLFSIRDAWYENLGDTTGLAREMSSSGCRPRLKNARA